MQSPTVSIVIAAHQAEDTIERSVRSVLGQTYGELEVVVVDDGSTDRTPQVVADLADRLPDDRLIAVTLDENKGPSAARNRGLASARGRWIGFLDADDEFVPDFVERMLAAARADPAADVVAGAHHIVRTDGTTRVRRQHGPGDLSGGDAAVRMLEYGITHYVWDKLFRRDVLGTAPFPAEIHRGEDLPVVLGAFIASDVVRLVDDALVTYYVSPFSLTWGRVAPIDESEELIRVVRQRSDPMLDTDRARAALALAESHIYLNAAHQAITRLPPSEAVDFCRRSAARIPWPVALRTLRYRPVDGAAAALLKTVPRMYRLAYRRYIRSAYSIAD